MAKLRKLAGWLPAVGAMIFNGCVIGWLHCTKPQLLGSSVPGNVIAVGYTILFLLWWCLAPAATACVIGGPFFLWCAALLPAELLFALTALRQVWPVGVLLAVLWFAGVFWFRRRSFRQFRRQSRRCGYDDFALLCGEDRVRENCRRFGVLLATLLLAVPACCGMWSSRVYLTAAAPLQTQAETTAQLHEKKFLPGFAEDAWETASLDSKTELAKQLAAYELAMLGVPDGTEVTVQPLDEDWLGYYSVSSRQIVLSRSVLKSETAQETMDTIAHEAYHAQQAYVVENIDWDDAATQAAYYDQARRWLRNYQSGYVSGDEDILGYYFQPVEADARAYAKEETERLQELISRNLQEDK